MYFSILVYLSAFEQTRRQNVSGMSILKRSKLHLFGYCNNSKNGLRKIHKGEMPNLPPSPLFHAASLSFILCPIFPSCPLSHPSPISPSKLSLQPKSVQKTHTFSQVQI